MDKHYDANIYRHLKMIFEQESWNDLSDYLQSLSNAAFRTAGYIMGEKLLLETERSKFWNVFAKIVVISPKAFLVTMLKTATKRYCDVTIGIEDDSLKTFAEIVCQEKQEINRKKFLEIFLPFIVEPSHIEHLFDLFHVEEANERIMFLFGSEAKAAYFVMFKAMKEIEDNSELLSKCCTQMLKRKNTNLTFNFVSIVRAYFGLNGVNATFSLTLDPYKLSLLDSAEYKTFVKLIESV